MKSQKILIIQSEICGGCIIILASHREIKLTDIWLKLPLKILGWLEKLFQKILIIVYWIAIVILWNKLG